MTRLLIFAFFLGCNAPAFAYIDPNAGGFLYQIIFPVLIAISAGWIWIKKAAIALWKKIFPGRTSLDD